MESGVTSSWQPWVPGFPMSQHWGLFCLISVSAIWKRGSGTIYQFVDYTNLAGVLVCFRKVLQGTGWIDGLRTKVWNQWDRVPCPTLGDTETLSKAPGLGQCGWNAAWWKRTWGGGQQELNKCVPSCPKANGILAYIRNSGASRTWEVYRDPLQLLYSRQETFCKGLNYLQTAQLYWKTQWWDWSVSLFCMLILLRLFSAVPKYSYCKYRTDQGLLITLKETAVRLPCPLHKAIAATPSQWTIGIT